MRNFIVESGDFITTSGIYRGPLLRNFDAGAVVDDSGPLGLRLV